MTMHQGKRDSPPLVALCAHLAAKGFCPLGNACTFAHDLKELKIRNDRIHRQHPYGRLGNFSGWKGTPGQNELLPTQRLTVLTIYHALKCLKKGEPPPSWVGNLMLEGTSRYGRELLEDLIDMTKPAPDPPPLANGEKPKLPLREDRGYGGWRPKAERSNMRRSASRRRRSPGTRATTTSATSPNHSGHNTNWQHRWLGEEGNEVPTKSGRPMRNSEHTGKDLRLARLSASTPATQLRSASKPAAQLQPNSKVMRRSLSQTQQPMRLESPLRATQQQRVGRSRSHRRSSGLFF